MIRPFIFPAVLALTMSLLAACSGGSSLNGSPVSNSSNGEFTQLGGTSSGSTALQGNAAASAQKIFAANSGNEAGSDDYKVAALDVLEITVLGVPDLTRTAQVSSTGMITLPLIKAVKAGGKTQAQIERDIAAKLEAGFLQSPQVSVFVKEYNSQRVTVEGAVNKPGIYPMTGKVSLLQSLALAEGLNAVADPTGVIVFRSVDGKRMAARFNIKDVRGGKVNDPQLQAGDVVMVDESSARTTLRDVKDALPLTGLFQLLLL
jgi:polysaccharide export outer membrane protein